MKSGLYKGVAFGERGLERGPLKLKGKQKKITEFVCFVSCLRLQFFLLDFETLSESGVFFLNFICTLHFTESQT
jgi:hypothetical protein